MKKRTNPKGPDGKFLSMSPKRIARRKPKDGRGGARPNAGRPPSQIKKRFAALTLLHRGVSIPEVARQIDSTEARITKWLLNGQSFEDCLPQELQAHLNSLRNHQTALTDGEPSVEFSYDVDALLQPARLDDGPEPTSSAAGVLPTALQRVPGDHTSTGE